MDTEIEAEMLHDTDKLNQREKNNPNILCRRENSKISFVQINPDLTRSQANAAIVGDMQP